MKKKLLVGGILLIVMSISIPAWASFIYLVDDGTGEEAIGATLGGDLTWANQFTANGGSDVITEIQAAVGSTTFAGSLDGYSVVASLWNDVNNDGNPGDAILLNSIGGTVANTGTDFFNIFDIPDTAVTGSFFVGLTIRHPSGTYPARLDEDTPNYNVSWITLGTDLQTGEHVASLGWPGDFMIRAVADPIPEPTTMLLLGTGLVGVAGAARRRKKKKQA